MDIPYHPYGHDNGGGRTIDWYLGSQTTEKPIGRENAAGNYFAVLEGSGQTFSYIVEIRER